MPVRLTKNIASPEIYDAVVGEVDLVIMDLKNYDNKVHREVTGVENTRILENYKHLAVLGKGCIIRTPVIPGVNDKPEEIRTIAKLAAKAKGFIYYELMPYHGFGIGKLESMGMNPKQEKVLVPPDAEHMEMLREAARDAGIPVK